jgi:serine/threonine protein kinase
MIRAIGPYQLVRRLGRGGMAEVHLAIAHGASGFERRVAIKRLGPELAGDPDLERALIREATLGGTLHHRNLVSVLGLGVHDGGYYVVMEYVDGGDLARLLDGPLPEPVALRIMHEVALGLTYLHAATAASGLPLDIVHRDVGPSNVLVSTTGDVKLGDFGIAKPTALADLTAAGTRKGRYAYMAPEQLAGEPLTVAADQFGLGVTLVELVAGARPFAGENPWQLRDAIQAGPTLTGLAPDLAAIAARALAFDAGDRYGSVDELRRAIIDAQDRRPPATAIDLGDWVRVRMAAAPAGSGSPLR